MLDGIEMVGEAYCCGDCFVEDFLAASEYVYYRAIGFEGLSIH